MKTPRIRLVTVSAATLALVVAGSAAVAAHPGDRGDRSDVGFGGFGRFEQRFDLRGQMPGMLGAAVDRFVRSEVTFQADDGFVTQRVDNGTVVSTSEAGVEYALADGQSASVSTGEDTAVIAVSVQDVEFGRRGLTRQRLVPEAVDAASIEAGSEITVWARSQEDGTFLAQRIVIHPAADEAASDDTDEAEAGDTDEAEAGSDATETEGAAVTDA